MTVARSLPDWPLLDLPHDAVEVGRWAGAWGVRGEFKVQPFSPDAAALCHCRDWWVQPPHPTVDSGQGWVLKLRRNARWHGSVLVGASAALTDREQAQALQGARIFLPREVFPKTGKDEFYWVDLIGLDVVNRAGMDLGVVHDLLSTGAQTVLVLRNTRVQPPHQRMIPFVSTYIDTVDLQARRICVDWSPDYD